MTKEALATLLDGAQYPFNLPEALARQAEDAGLVVVFGARDDLMEFRGAITDEVSACNGAEVLMTADGILKNECFGRCRYFRQAEAAARRHGRTITAVWDAEGYSWIYATVIPHVTFEIMEGGEKYCRGIVFALADIG